ncbi:MAG: hypothetical protein Tsb0015_13150 [Simkaniaceae bacterium]
MKRSWKLVFLLLPFSLSAFEIKPWYPTIYQFEFRPSFTVQHYPQVDNAVNPKNYSSTDEILTLNLGIPFTPNWDIQIETELDNTKKRSFGLLSGGLQLRYQLLDDISGDPFSLTVGMSYRGVPYNRLEDVSTPYHFVSNFEVHSAIGKELARRSTWIFRTFAFLGAGIANKGSPWLRPLVSFETNIQDRHQIELFAEGYFGFGDQSKVNIRRFSGYQNIEHRSIDGAIVYRRIFAIWGSLEFQFLRRLYAHSYPERLNAFTVTYRLPFSIF